MQRGRMDLPWARNISHLPPRASVDRCCHPAFPSCVCSKRYALLKFSQTVSGPQTCHGDGADNVPDVSSHQSFDRGYPMEIRERLFFACVGMLARADAIQNIGRARQVAGSRRSRIDDIKTAFEMNGTGWEASGQAPAGDAERAVAPLGIVPQRCRVHRLLHRDHVQGDRMDPRAALHLGQQCRSRC